MQTGNVAFLTKPLGTWSAESEALVIFIVCGGAHADSNQLDRNWVENIYDGSFRYRYSQNSISLCKLSWLASFKYSDILQDAGLFLISFLQSNFEVTHVKHSAVLGSV